MNHIVPAVDATALDSAASTFSCWAEGCLETCVEGPFKPKTGGWLKYISNCWQDDSPTPQKKTLSCGKSTKNGNHDAVVHPTLFPTCQVRVVRFYVSCRSSFSSSSSAASGPQPRPSTPSVRCRTSTTTSQAQCSLPDLNHDQPRPVFAAKPQPRPSTPSVRCRTSTTTIHAQRSLPDLNHDHPRPVFAAGPQLLCQKLCQIECQKT